METWTLVFGGGGVVVVVVVVMVEIRERAEKLVDRNWSNVDEILERILLLLLLLLLLFLLL